MKNRYHFICWLCCIVVGFTPSFAQEDHRNVASFATQLPTSVEQPSTLTDQYKQIEKVVFLSDEETQIENFQVPIDVNFVHQAQTVCANVAPAMLQGSAPTGGDGPGTYLYQWQSSTTSATAGFSDISLATNLNYSPSGLTATTWYRRVVVSGSESDTSVAVAITIKPAAINLTITNPPAVCAPQMVDITAAAITAGSTPGLTLTYHTTSASNAPVLTNPSAISTATFLNRDYYIKATNGCQTPVIRPVRVVINKQPTVSISSPPGPVCKYSMVPLVAFSTDMGSTTEWVNIGPGPMVMVYPSEATTYTAIATMPVTGCQRAVQVPITVRDFSMELSANPQPVTAGTPVTLTPGSITNFTVNGWLPENLFPNQTAATQSFIINDTTRTFFVIGVSEDGCSDTASVNVNIAVNTTDIFVPNAFTPNNDGKNDIFKAYGSSIKNIEMKIFDQWGRAVHETNNNSIGWDGTHKGKAQPAGVYMYVIKIRLHNEDSFIKKGTINLIR